MNKNFSANLNIDKYTLKSGSPLSENQLNIYLDIMTNKKEESYLISLSIKLDSYSSKQIVNAVKLITDAHPILKGYITNINNNPWLKIGNSPNIDIVDSINSEKLKHYLGKPFNINKNLSRYLYNKQEKTLYAIFHQIIFDWMSVSVFKKHIQYILDNKQSNYIDKAFLLRSAFFEEVKHTDLYEQASIFYEREFCDSQNLSEPIPDIGDNAPSYNIIKLANNKNQIDNFIKKHKITRGILYTSVFAYMLSRYTNSNKSCFSLIENGRDRLNADISIGMFINTLPIVIDCTDTTISSYIDMVKNKIYKITEYNFYPNRLLSKKYNIKNNIQFQYQHNIFTNSKDFENRENTSLNSSDIKERNSLISDLSFVATDDTISVTSSSKYSSDTAKKMLETYELILDELLIKDKLSDINYTSKKDLSFFKQINETTIKLKYNDILEAFNWSVEKYPNNNLVCYKGMKYTYAQSSLWIHKLLNQLKDIPKKSNIAILVPRSHYYMLTSLAVLAHGSAYVPIDDAYPDKRIAFMLKDSNVSAVLATDKTLVRAKKLTNKRIVNVCDIDNDLIIKNTNAPKSIPINSSPEDTAIVLYTSGTTGKPKGTKIVRLGINNLAEWYTNMTMLNNTDNFALYSSFSFDAHIEAFYPSIYSGASVDILPNSIRYDINKLLNHIDKNQISHILFPTALMKMVKNKNLPNCLKVILTGGEALGKYEVSGHYSLYDAYGPTEATVITNLIKVKDKSNPTSIGNLIYNTKAYILDKELRRVPFGAVGELYLSGFQLSKGYLNRDKETKLSFIANSFDGVVEGYEMMYKTGDIVRYLPDKTLGFIGRADTQVKIRGNRVELGEVEACIRDIKEIKDVTVQTITNNGNKELVAYVVLNGSVKNMKQIITKHVLNEKPDYMVPTHIKVLDKIPLNINGKVDTRKLPKPDIIKSTSKYIAPTNNVERAICEAFSQVFNIDNIGIQDDFIELGGDSLTAIYLLSILKDFNFSVANILSSGSPKKLANIYKTYNLKEINNTKFSLEKGVPLSNSQINVYLDQKISDKYNAYRIYDILKIDKQFSYEDINKALNKLIDSYPILSTKVEDRIDGPYLVKGITPLIDYTTDYKNIDTDIKFDLNKGPLAIFKIVKYRNKYYLYYVIHHLIFDGKSVEIFNNAFINLLKGKDSLIKDYSFIKASETDASINKSKIQNKHINVFDKMFGVVEQIPYIPFQDSGYASYINKELNIDIEKIQQFIKNNKITEAIFFDAVFGLVYSNFTYSNTPVFCITDNGRDFVDGNKAVGMFVKNIPIALSVKNTSVKSYIKHVFDTVINARESSTLPFHEYKSRYNVDSTVLCQYFSDYIQMSNNSQVNFINKDLHQNEIDNKVDYIADIDCYIYKENDVFKIIISHSEKYDDRLINSFANTIEVVANDLLIKQNVADIEYANKQEIEFLDNYNKTETSLRFNDVIDAFKYNVHKYPNNICCVYKEKKYTYKQIDILSNGFAQKLKEHGVNKQDCVAIHVDISEYYLITALAILKINAIYLPINTDYPKSYKTTLINESNTKLILVSDNTFLEVKSIKQINVDNIKPLENYKTNNYHPKDSACIIFTSGTTGIPKGAKITRIGLANLCDWQSRYINLSKRDIFGMYQSFSFVSHLDPMFSSLFVGASIDIIPQDVKQDINKLNSYFIKHNITAMKMGASIGRLFIEQIKDTSLRVIFLGGEKLGLLPTDRNYKIIDGYGPTENTAQTTAICLTDKSSIESIGYPIFNNKVYVLNQFGKRLPLYATGDIYAAGLSLSKGYVNNNTITKQLFLRNPFLNDKDYNIIYKIGDLVRYSFDGSLSYIGRSDKQIQIRGNRVELTEIALCIREIDEIKDVTVQTTIFNGSIEIVAYVVSRSNNNIDKIVKQYVQDHKPSYMVPTHIIVLDKIPLNNNGKVDIRALPIPELSRAQIKYVAPTNDTEKIVCEAFSQVLNIDTISIEDDFITLGGDSLSAIRMLSILKDYNITAIDITNLRTPKEISRKIREINALNLKLDKYTINDGCPLSEQQLNVYLDIIINEKLESYLIPLSIKLDKYSIKEIVNAINKVVDIHPILKGFITEKNNNPWINIGDTPKVDVVGEINTEDLKQYLSKPFNINKHLSRYLYSKTDKTLYAVFHHLVFDGLSTVVFLKDLQNILDNKQIKYVDTSFLISSAYSEEIKKTDLYKQASKFCESQFCDYDDILELIEDIGENKPSYILMELDIDSNKIDEFIKKHKITKGVLYTGVFAYMLSRFTNSDKSYFSMIDNGRDRFDAENSVGMFVNTLPILIDCANTNIDNFMIRCNDNIYKTLHYNFYPYRLLAKKYNLHNSIVFQYQPDELLDDIDASTNENGFLYDEDIKDRSDLISDLSFVVTDTSISVTSSSKYSSETTKKMLETYKCILNEILIKDKLSDINYTTNKDINLYKQINKTETQLKYKDILEAFNASLAKYPNNILVSCNDTNYTYAQSSIWIHEMLKKLKDIPNKSNIAILVPRSHYYLLTALAVLSHGSAYVPIDDTYPYERIKFMLKDADASAVLVTDETLDLANNLTKKLIINISDIDSSVTIKDIITPKPLPINSSPGNKAVILYTSGTTGIPKGTLINRLSIANMSQYYSNLVNMNDKDVYGLYSSFGFDMHTSAFYTPVIVGASVNIIPSKIILNMKLLNNYIKKYNITHTFMTVKVAKLFLNTNKIITLKSILTGGESIGLFNTNNKSCIYYGYGPTEYLAVTSAIHESNIIDHSTLGNLAYNSKAYILDRELRQVPYGAQGELYLSGYQLANGYLNRDEETSKAFFKNPFDGNINGYELMYKTGDIVRYLPDKTLGFISRDDNQVKIRGNRVELGEVETCIREIKGIKDATVQTIINNNNKELIAYVVIEKLDKTKEHIKDVITKYVSNKKPQYMVPTYIVVLDRIPLNINGKIDRRALPIPDITQSKTKYIAPTNDTEKIVCNAFSQVFNVDKIGIEDDFKLLGGDSIKAIRLISILNDNNLNVEASNILNLLTPKNIANTLKINHAKTYMPSTGNIGLLPIQNYYFDKINSDGFSQFYVVKANEELDLDKLQLALNKLTNCQDILRAKYNSNYQIIQKIDTQVTTINSIITKKQIKTTLKEEIKKSINSLNIDNNHLIDIKLINKRYITFVIHHLLIDGVSWAILLDNLASLYNSKDISRPYPYAEYIKEIKEYSKTITNETIDKYKSLTDKIEETKICGHPFSFLKEIEISFNTNNPYSLSEHEYLLLAISRAYKKTYNSDIVYQMESFGRDETIADVKRTIGWFTSIYPMEVISKGKNDLSSIIKDLYEIKKSILNNKHLGIDYLSICYYLKALKFKYMPVTFNFLSDEFSYNNELFKEVDYFLEQKFEVGETDTTRTSYGMSLNIKRNNNTYIISGDCADKTYLSDQYIDFLDNIQKEIKIIDNALFNKTYIYPLYEEPLGVYLDEKMNNKECAYSCFGYVEIDKCLNMNQIKDKIEKLMYAHPVLRTRIIDIDGIPCGITDSKPTIKILNKLFCDIDINDFIKPFILDKSLTRFYIIKNKDKNIVAYDIHHIISDATSRTLINYELKNNIIEDIDLGFIKKANECIRERYSDRYKLAKDFYNREFCDAANIVELLKDVNNEYGGYARMYLGDIKEKILDFSNKLFITTNQIFTSIFAYTLSRFVNSDKVYFTFTNHGRDLGGLEKSFGMYVRTVPIVIDVKNRTINAYLKETSKHILDAMESSIFPFRLLVNLYNINQNISFEYNSDLNDVNNIDKSHINYIKDKQKHTAHVSDLIGVINDCDDGYVLTVDHSCKYSRSTIVRFVKTFKRILDEFFIKDKLSDINYTTMEDWDLFRQINKTESQLKYKDILEAFNMSLKKYPNNTLVSYKDIKFSYAQSSIWINKLLDKLKDIPHKTNIAILVPRSHYYLLTSLSVLSFGCAYVPIDDTYPDERIKFMLKDSSVSAILVTDDTLSRVKKISNKTIINISDIDNCVTTKEDITPKPLSINSSCEETAVILYTSGTTGKPKGTLITRRAILNFSEWCSKYSKSNKHSVFGLYSSFGFDAHIKPLYSSMIFGSSCNIIPQEYRLDMDKLNQYITSNNISDLFLTTQVGRAFVKSTKKTSLKNLFIGGEKNGQFRGSDICDMYQPYGPTENTVFSTSIPFKLMIDDSSIGNLVSNTKAYILDKEHRPVPFGAQGELYLSGYQLAKGYLNRDKDTKASFIKNQFDGNTSGYEMMYKTGDIVRFLPDKTLGFIGRADSQVKIRGNRVELGEIESSIREIKNIKDVTVQIITNNNNKELVAYVVVDKKYKTSKENKTKNYDKYIKDTIKKHISDTKPSYMIPSYIVIQDKIPLNINGKVDIRALPKPDITELKTKYIAPTNDTERIICEAFSQVFNIDNIGIEDDFYALGGDSLSAIHLLSLLKELHLSITDILNEKTPKNLSLKVNKGFNIKALNKYNEKTGHPLSNMQLSMMLDIEMRNKSDIYIISRKIELKDKYSEKEIKNAIYKTAKILPEICSKLVLKGNTQWIETSSKVNYRFLESYDKDKIEKFNNKPFDLNKNLSRFLLVKKNKDYILYYAMHHLIFDFYSSIIFKKTLYKLLENQNVEVDLSSFKLSEFDELSPNLEIYKSGMNFFINNLSNIDLCNKIPYDENSKESGILISNIPLNNEKLDSYCDLLNITKGAFFSGVFAYIYSRFSGMDWSQFCITTSGRNNIFDENSFGLFSQTVPIIANCKDMKIKDFFKKYNEDYLSVLKYDFIPFNKLVSNFEIDGDTVFQYIPNYHGNTNEAQNLKDFETVDDNIFYESTGSSQTISDFLMYVQEYEDVFNIFVSHSSKYCKEKIINFVKSYSLAVAQFLYRDKLSDINCVSEKNINDFQLANKTNSKIEFSDILDAFSINVKKFADQKCVVCNNEIYTYKEVDSISNYICELLISNGIQNGDAVAFLTQRGPLYLICILAILKLNAIYIPIDSSLPVNRISEMLTEGKSKFILLDEGLENTYVPILKNSNIKKITIHRNNLQKSILDKPKYKCTKPEIFSTCGIVYTSGSTGKPKAVCITRQGILNLAHWYNKTFEISNEDVYGYYPSIGFVVHLHMFYALYCGATVDIVPDDIRFNMKSLNSYFINHKITHSFLTSRVAQEFFTTQKNDILKVCQKGGENLKEFEYNGKTLIFEGYGASETCAASMFIDKRKKIFSNVIGNPISNTKAYILDSNMNYVPPYALGQLYISGKCLSNGYLNYKKLNNEVFLKNKFSHYNNYKLMYKTGDYGYRLDNTNIVNVGRIDSQVKIRGNRVELGEVEESIKEVSGIKDVTIQTITNNNNKELVAYVVANKSTKMDKSIKESIMQHVSKSKPAYMVPTHIVILDKIPLNINGKVDHRALPKPDIKKSKTKYVAPTNDTERIICDAFSQVFNIEKVGINDDFIELGGDSLTAIRLLSILKDFNFTVVNILSSGTPKQLANIYKNHKTNKLYITKFSLDNGVPLSNAQINVYYDQKIHNKYDAYKIYNVLEIGNQFSREDIKKALKILIDAYPILSTKVEDRSDGPYLVKGIPPQINYTTDLHNIETHNKLNPNKGPLAIFDVVKHNNKYYLSYVVYHIIFDGKSAEILNNVFNKILNAEDILEKDYSFLKASEVDCSINKSEIQNTHIKFFDKMFGDIKLMPYIHPQDSGYVSYVNKNINIDIKPLQQFIKDNKITEAIFFEAVFGLVYSNFTYSDTPVFCITDNGRDFVDSDRAIGMYVKNIPIALSVKNTSVESYIKHVFNTIIKARESSSLPFYEYNNRYNIEAAVIFQYFSNYIQMSNNSQIDLHNEGSGSNEIKNKETSIADIDCYLYKENSKFKVLISHSEKYDNKLINSFANTIEVVANDLLVKQNLADIEYTTNQDIKFLDKQNNTETELRFNDVIDAFKYNANKYPDNLCCVYKDKKFTYKQIDVLSNGVAQKLKNLGVKMQDRVAVHVDISEYYLITTLAILKLNAIYIPINTDYPLPYKKTLINESNAKFILVTSNTMLYANDSVQIKVNDISAVDNFKNSNYRSKDTACIIFTSGTTGKPKGAKITRVGIANLCDWQSRYINLDKKDTFGMYQNFSFVSHLDPMFSPVFVGASIDIIPKNVKQDINKLNDYFISHNVTAMKMGASIGRLFIEQIKDTSLRVMYLSGEKLGKITQKRSYNIIDAYGPTENTAQTTAIYLKDKSCIESIGYPIFNNKVYVLNQFGKRLPLYAAGIIYASGLSLSEGYINNDELTKRVFTKNPFSEDKTYSNMYKIGDLVRFSYDGSISYIGRADKQIQIRGNRVELTEITQCIREIKEIKDVTVQAITNNENVEIVAYVVPQRNNNDICKIVKQYVQDHKPNFMVPDYVMTLDKIPLNANSKVDKSLLPKPDYAESSYIPPRNNTDRIIHDIVKKELNIDDDISITFNLKNYGLNSLLLISLKTKFYNEGIDLDLIEMQKQTDIESWSNLFSKIELYKEDNSNKSNREKIKDYYALTDCGDIISDSINVLKPISNHLYFFSMPKAFIVYDYDPYKVKEAILNVLNCHLGLKAKLVYSNNKFCFKRRDDWNPSINIKKINKFPSKHFNTKQFRPFNIYKDELIKIKIYEYKGNSCVYINVHHILFDAYSEVVFYNDLYKALAGKKIYKEKYNVYNFIDDQQKYYLSKKGLEDRDYFIDLFNKNPKMSDFTITKTKKTISNMGVIFKFLQKNVFRYNIYKKLDIDNFCSKNDISQSNLFLGSFIYTFCSVMNTDIVFIGGVSSKRYTSNTNNTIASIAGGYIIFYKHNPKNDFISTLKDLDSKSLDMHKMNYSYLQCKKPIPSERTIAYDYVASNAIEQNIDMDKTSLNIEDLKFKYKSGIPVPFFMSVHNDKNGDYEFSFSYNANLYNMNEIDTFISKLDELINSYINLDR